MNNNITYQQFDMIDNCNNLKNITPKLSKLDKIIQNIDSEEKIKCIKGHSGVQRTYLNPKGHGFEFINFKVGDVLPRNRVVLKPSNWILDNE